MKPMNGMMDIIAPVRIELVPSMISWDAKSEPRLCRAQSLNPVNEISFRINGIVPTNREKISSTTRPSGLLLSRVFLLFNDSLTLVVFITESLFSIQ